MKFTILASGSKGNAALLETDKTRLLIDCGLSARELGKRMAGKPPIGTMEGDAIILSHAHGDHAGGLAPVVGASIRRGRAVPVYLSGGTEEKINWGRIENPPIVSFRAGCRLEIGDIGVETFTCMHDCVNPVNFVFTAEGIRIGFSTDLGSVPPAMRRLFRDCQIIVLESNHDTDMLAASSYPDPVKDRVSGPLGHLSNAQAAEYLSGMEIVSGVRRTIVLGHLSEEANTPGLATWSARRALLAAGNPAELLVASQDEVLLVAP